MNYDLLLAGLGQRRIKIALTGAKGGFGRSLLVQCRAIPAIEIAALCDLDLDGTMQVLASLGLAGQAVVCGDAKAVQAAQAAGQIALVREHGLLAALDLDIVVEATGVPEVSVRIALDAIDRGQHVAMVTKETDSVAGPHLAARAKEKGVVYTTADGDQPSNLIGLVTWARALGFEVVAAGKSSEYDYVYAPERGQVTYTDRTIEVPGLATLWRLGADAAATVEARSQALAALPQSATPDYCEMNVVANSTGLGPACDAMSYPLCRISELADIFVPKEEGGILERTGVVDVFNCLRREDEASFGGGVFVIVRCTDAEVWETLRQKGHVVSRNGRHACIYLPYHLMGLETPISLFTAVLLKQPSGAATQAAHAVMAARTTRAFKAGEKLAMGGHHHVIEGVEPRLLPGNRESFGLAPFYLAANKALTRDVPAGALITPDMLDLAGSDLAAAWQGTLACSTALRNA